MWLGLNRLGLGFGLSLGLELLSAMQLSQEFVGSGLLDFELLVQGFDALELGGVFES